jgi:hypothetical protein
VVRYLAERRAVDTERPASDGANRQRPPPFPPPFPQPPPPAPHRAANPDCAGVHGIVRTVNIKKVPLVLFISKMLYKLVSTGRQRPESTTADRLDALARGERVRAERRGRLPQGAGGQRPPAAEVRPRHRAKICVGLFLMLFIQRGRDANCEWSLSRDNFLF